MNRIVSFFLLVIISPILLALIVLGVFLYSKPLFFQNRTGYHLSSLKLIKLRSIPKEAQEPNRWGRFLRKYSLDELLQIVNIVKGEMNFIGPRPLLPEYDSLYSGYHKKRFLVKPGLTGWAQVKGRNNISWNEQFDLDVWYVENQTFWLDCKIIVLTFLKILHPKKEETKMRAPFDGTN